MFMEKIGKKNAKTVRRFFAQKLASFKNISYLCPQKDNMEQQTDIRWIQRYAKLSQDQNYQQV